MGGPLTGPKLLNNGKDSEGVLPAVEADGGARLLDDDLTLSDNFNF